MATKKASTDIVPVDDAAHRKMVEQRTLSLPGVKTLEEYMKSRQEMGLAVLNADDALGILNVEKTKEELCGVPLILDSWTFNETDMGASGEFVSVVFIEFTKTGEMVRKGVFNDGSTGIYSQLREYTDRALASGNPQDVNAAYGPFYSRKGLNYSDYTVEVEENGQTVTKEARTYYVAG